MNDLVSRSKIIEEIETCGGDVESLHKYIREMPTAYDIDKVFKELEKAKTINVDVGFGTIYETIQKDVALEIVKRGMC